MNCITFTNFPTGKRIPRPFFLRKNLSVNYTDTNNSKKRFSLEKKFSEKNKSLFYIAEHVFLRNSYNNIISKQTTNIIYKKHIFDSLTVSSVLRSFWGNTYPKCCIDFGTGGGFPGLVLSIFFPEMFIVLLDSIEKKNNFHMGMFNILDIKNCKSVCLRGENLVQLKVHRKKYDMIVSRAVAELTILLGLFSKMSKFNGKFIAMKKITGCGKEIDNTSSDFLNLKLKLKCLVKVDKKNLGKVLFLYKNY